jgi:hypothetical protein
MRSGAISILKSENFYPRMSPRKLKIGISIWSFTPKVGGLQSHAERFA